MADIPGAPAFETSLNDLQDHLPTWWRTRDPTSDLYQLLNAPASVLDQLAVLWTRFAGDTALVTASEVGLVRNFAFAWGLQQEQLPPTVDQLEPYVQEWAADDGSLDSMVRILTALVDTDVNTTGGTILKFPVGGGGLTFPSNGLGLTLYATAPGSEPTGGLVLPATFPEFPSTVASDNVVVNDGTTPAPPGPGLIFAQNGFISITMSYQTYTWTVKVLSSLAFDRAAFARAVARLSPAHFLPATIIEVPSL